MVGCTGPTTMADEFGFDDDALLGLDMDTLVAQAQAPKQPPAAAAAKAAFGGGGFGSHMQQDAKKESPPTSPPEEEPDWGAEEDFLAGLNSGGGGGSQPMSQHEQEIPDDFMSEMSANGRASGAAASAGGSASTFGSVSQPPVKQEVRCAAAPSLGGGASDDQLRSALQSFYGHDDFRSGQLDAVRAACSGQDVCVFWATGEGKSLVYQLPALTTGRISLVVSPLVSLMTDQVAALNHTIGGGKEISCFLGSAQMDGSVESRALAGEYKVVYITPEKLYTGFLDRLQP